MLPLLDSSADRTRLPAVPVSSLSRKRESRDPVKAAVGLPRRRAGGEGDGDEAAVVDAGERLLVVL